MTALIKNCSTAINTMQMYNKYLCMVKYVRTVDTMGRQEDHIQCVDQSIGLSEVTPINLSKDGEIFRFRAATWPYEKISNYEKIDVCIFCIA